MLQLKLKRDFSHLQNEICVNDLVILENYLNESVKLRLINSGTDEKRFKEAHEISTIITRNLQAHHAKSNIYNPSLFR